MLRITKVSFLLFSIAILSYAANLSASEPTENPDIGGTEMGTELGIRTELGMGLGLGLGTNVHDGAIASGDHGNGGRGEILESDRSESAFAGQGYGLNGMLENDHGDEEYEDESDAEFNSKNSYGGSSINGNGFINESSGAKEECSVSEYVFSGSEDLDRLEIEYCAQNVVSTSNALELNICEECGTTLIVPEKLEHGKVEGRVKMAPGSGAVTALILINLETGDEIDFEWVGIDSSTVQSMYFVGGQRVGQDQEAQLHSGSGDMSESFHNYAIELTPNAINWYIDDSLVRTVANDGSGNFPATANEIRFGAWVGSEFSSWAGVMDHSAKSVGIFEWIKVTHYC